jgi:putative transposase
MDRTFFITSVTTQRTNAFQHDVAADLFIDVLLHYRAERKYLLHEFVLVGNRFHALLTPSPQISLERAVQFIKGGFSFRLKSSFPVWQPGFTNHPIRDDEDFARHREYIRMNPVRAGLAQRPEEHLFSSASGRYALDPAPQGLGPDLILARTPA